MTRTLVEKIEKKHRVVEEPCNICGAPFEVTYQEKDEETGKIVSKTHTVDCGGHKMIPTYLWNKVNKHVTGVNPSYDDFQKFFVRQKTRTTKKESV